MGKAIRIHLGRDSKSTYCGIVINKNISIATRGEVFFEVDNNPIKFNCLCRNCVSLFAKNKIYNHYIEKVKYNESIIAYEEKLPKSIRAMKYYCAKRKLNWNKKNTNPIEKLQAKVITRNDDFDSEAIKDLDNSFSTAINKIHNKIEAIDMGKSLSDSLLPQEEIIELTNPIAIGEKTDKGINRELRKKGILPYFKKVDKSIDRISNGLPIAMIRGFGNCWKVIEEMSSMSNCNASHVKELSGWVTIELAQKIYNQYVINRVME
jgi:hypothetical protein